MVLKHLNYKDSELKKGEMIMTISSMIIGVGVLTLPRLLSVSVSSSDGWISIVIAGFISMGLAWLLGKMSMQFHKQGFYEYAASIITRPLAKVMICAISLYFILFAAFEVRSISIIAKHYLFERTPIQYISLTFIWVVSYAVAGRRVVLFRLNTFFLPLVLGVLMIVLLFSLTNFHLRDLKPFFISDWREVAAGAKDSIFSMLGFELILFYGTLMNKPQDAPAAAVFGVGIPVALYLVIFIVCVGVFSQPVLQEVTYPAIEIAKEMQFPGEFFERFESIFFLVWIMTIFNTATMGMDLAIYSLSSMIKGWKKVFWVSALSPVIYGISMIPSNQLEFAFLGSIASYAGGVFAILVPLLIWGIAKLRGGIRK